ncbi:MAG TPA: ABC transporter permease, partial [Bacteroidales bacterium]|nr:ABC transporter permease [Bacteroidales bacterium]
LLEAPILAIILAFFTKSSRSLTGQSEYYVFGENINIPGYLFMSVIVALFLGLVISAEEIFRDRKILEREKFLNLSRSSYLDAKVFVMLIISAIQMITFVLLGNFLLEIKGMDWRFFLILFFAACWANMIGLNISAGFNSVVTIYILVPLILIPQLLFSGVVINFQNMNDKIKTEKYVPVIGDMMISRWVYEGLMVTQFKDNRFERNFYDEDQAISTASYIKSYLIPELRDLSNECFQNIEKKKMYDRTNRNFSIIKNELDKIYSYSGINPGKLIDSLHFESYTTAIHHQLSALLDRIEMHALGRYRSATNKKDKIFEGMKSASGGIESFVRFRKKYHNRKVSSMVLDEDEIYEYRLSDDEVIRIKEPIYTYPESRFGRAHYYAPVKRIGMLVIDTFWFNILRILFSVFLLYLVLYFDLLNKLIRYIDDIRLRRLSRRRFLRLLKQSEIRQN